MSAPKWTPAQRAAIEDRGGTLLVSAAAGSGKTAVLVERIITKLLREEQEIDRLLVVTFTNAAASEMRQRIGVAIAKQLEETPEDIHLQNQMAFLPRADIKTIHAFCLQVIREYYHLLELDPKVRTADPAEIKLLQKEVLEELFETLYAAEDSQWFFDLLETFSSSTKDTPLQELVLQLYTFAEGSLNPKRQLEQLAESLFLAEGETVDACGWFSLIRQSVETSLDYARYQLKKELIRLQKSQNTGILFVTHSIDEALLLGHKIAFIEDGCIKKEFLLDTDCENRDLLSKELIELKREILAQLHL